MKLSDIRVRDPYILQHEGVYYLYATFLLDIDDNKLRVMKSTDLENWDDAKVIFELEGDSWAVGEPWAPEVHVYDGKFYLFVSLLGKHGKRGTQIAVSDTPDGVYKPIINAPGTPMADSCIDGTLHVENDEPYIVYSADWPDNFNREKGYYSGKICALKLTKDLKYPAGEPFLIFSSDDAPCSFGRPAVHEYLGETVTRYGSDGPYIIRLKSGSLLLTWSPIPDMNYIVATAVSESGSIRGPWRHLETPLFENNGGHAMFFDDGTNNKKMVIHWPECFGSERTKIFDFFDDGKEFFIK